MAGLDPAIHLLRKSRSKMMDTRVKPAHDTASVAASRAKFLIQFSNSRAFTFSRRKASEVYQPLVNRARRPSYLTSSHLFNFLCGLSVNRPVIVHPLGRFVQAAEA
jgi:hypothetical protein